MSLRCLFVDVHLISDIIETNYDVLVFKRNVDLEYLTFEQSNQVLLKSVLIHFICQQVYFINIALPPATERFHSDLHSNYNATTKIVACLA